MNINLTLLTYTTKNHLQHMLSRHNILHSKHKFRVCSSHKGIVNIDISIDNIREDSNRIEDIQICLHKVLLIRLKIHNHLLRVAKLAVVDIESGLRLCSHLDNQSVIVICSLAPHQLVIRVQSDLQIINIRLSHTIDMELYSCTRTARAIFCYRVYIHTRKCICLHSRKTRLLQHKYLRRFLSLCRSKHKQQQKRCD